MLSIKYEFHNIKKGSVEETVLGITGYSALCSVLFSDVMQKKNCIVVKCQPCQLQRSYYILLSIPEWNRERKYLLCTASQEL